MQTWVVNYGAVGYVKKLIILVSERTHFRTREFLKNFFQDMGLFPKIFFVIYSQIAANYLIISFCVEIFYR